jgi:ubiquitin carboxyl-terminal hydrolase 22/27/51
VYSSDPSPLAPASFLHAFWKYYSTSTSPTSTSNTINSTPEIVGYAQHDAHEVFIHVLNALHSHASLPSSHSPPITSASPLGCSCLVHKTFGAQLQSDVRCGRCFTVRSTVDPILDLGLDLDRGAGASNTLAACLRR